MKSNRAQIVLAPSMVTCNVGGTVTMSLWIKSQDTLHCNAAKVIVWYDNSMLELIANPEAGEIWESQRLEGVVRLGSDIDDGDFGLSVWSAASGDDVALYPRADTNGLLMARMQFRLRKVGAALVQVAPAWDVADGPESPDGMPLCLYAMNRTRVCDARLDSPPVMLTSLGTATVVGE